MLEIFCYNLTRGPLKVQIIAAYQEQKVYVAGSQLLLYSALSKITLQKWKSLKFLTEELHKKGDQI